LDQQKHQEKDNRAIQIKATKLKLGRKKKLFKKHQHCGGKKIEPIIKTNTKIHIFGISKHLNALSQKPT